VIPDLCTQNKLPKCLWHCYTPSVFHSMSGLPLQRTLFLNYGPARRVTFFVGNAAHFPRAGSSCRNKRSPLNSGMAVKCGGIGSNSSRAPTRNGLEAYCLVMKRSCDCRPVLPSLSRARPEGCWKGRCWSLLPLVWLPTRICPQLWLRFGC